MPIAKVRMPDGRIGRFNVPEGTTPDEVVAFAGQQGIEEAEPPVAPGQPEAAGMATPTDTAILEPAATLVSGVIAEPLAGLAGLGKAAFAPSPEEAVRRGTETVAKTREALTFQPRTEGGKQSLQSLGKLFAPVGKGLQAAETFLGDETFKATKSPALAALATTLPTAALEVLGLASTKGVIKLSGKAKTLAKNKAIKKAVVESAPDIEKLKATKTAVYDELKDSGINVNPNAYDNLVRNIETKLKEGGLDRTITPDSFSAMKRFKSELGDVHSLSEIDTLRKVARGAAGSIKPADASLGMTMIDMIDDFLDAPIEGALTRGNIKASEVAAKYNIARELHGRASRSELITGALENARLVGGGNVEQAIVNEFKKILRGKQKRFFKPDEIEVMSQVIKRPTTTNFARVVGKLGLSEGQVVNAASGIAAGGIIAGGPGAIAVPLIGEVSKKLATKLTKGSAKYADAVIRAGVDAQKITKAYLANTPKAARSATELSELLLRPDIILDEALISGSKLLKEAAEISTGLRMFQAAGTGATVAAPGLLESLSTANNQMANSPEPQQEQPFAPTQRNRLSERLGQVKFAR